MFWRKFDGRTKAAGIAAGVAIATLAATGAQAQTKVPFALDWKFEGPSAALSLIHI